MKKKRNTKFRVSDLVLVLICLSIGASSFALFWIDLNKVQTKKNEKPIATITFKKRSAQRKISDRIIWDRLRQESPIYNGDTLRTAPQSEAILVFPNKTSVEVFENTMLQVYYSEETGAAVTLNNDEGTITCDTTNAEKGLEITSNKGQKINVDAGSAITTSSQNQNVSIVVQSGSASVSSEEGKLVKAQAGTTLEITKDGETREPSFSLITPSKDSKIISYNSSGEENKTNAVFTWKTTSESKSSNVVIDIAKDKNFSNIVSSNSFTNTNRANIPLPQGVYYYKAQSNDYAVTGKITVLQTSKPRLIIPEGGKSFSSFSKKINIRLVWQEVNNATAYKIEIADNSEMKDPVVTRNTELTNATITELAEGNWFWQITPYYSVNNEGYKNPSAISSFTIEKTQELLPPVTLLPKDNDEIQDNKKVAFSWKPSSDAKEYTLLLSKTKDMENAISKNVSSNYLLLNDNLPQGTWYWTVSQKDYENNTSKPSEPKTFNIIPKKVEVTKLISPPNSFLAQDTAVKNIKFIWSETSTFEIDDSNTSKGISYNLQIANNKEFSNPIVNINTISNYASDIDLPSGTYYWKVENSSANILVVQKALDSPIISSPKSGEDISIAEDTSIHFTWQNVPSASSYTFTLSSNDDSFEPITLRDLTEPNAVVLIPFSASAKKYSWTVRAMRNESENSTRLTGKTTQSIFSVVPPKNVELLSPLNLSSFEAQRASSRPITFSWTNELQLAQTFELYKVLTNGKEERVLTRNTKSSKTNVSNLNSGTYRWKIKSSTSNGYSLDSKESFTFTIKEPPRLAKPVLLLPKDKMIFASYYFRTHSSIQFTWEPVSAATSYKFEIYKTDDNGNRTKKIIDTTVNQPSFTLSNLSILDIGNFSWQVSGLSGRNGPDSSNSISSGSFIVDIPLPTNVTIEDQGVQYGE